MTEGKIQWHPAFYAALQKRMVMPRRCISYAVDCKSSIIQRAELLDAESEKRFEGWHQRCPIENEIAIGRSSKKCKRDHSLAKNE